ncbi:MAG: PAS domain-containing protein, partial [Ferruginibacter sp.]
MLELRNILYQYVREDARLFNHVHSNTILGFTFIDIRYENVSWTNPLLLKHLGYAFNEQENSDLPVTVFAPDTIADLVKTITSGTNNKKDEIEAKINCIRFDQTIIEASALVHLFADEKGTPAYLLILVESLQTQHFLIDQLTEDNQQFLEIIDGLKMGTWKWNVQSGSILVNKHWTGMLGYDEKELLPINNSTWNRLVHPEDNAIASAAFNAHFEGKTETYSCELRMRHKLGHWIWIEDRGKLIARTADGKPYIMVGSQIDITQKKLVEASLEDTKVRHLLATKLSAVGVWDWNVKDNTFDCDEEILSLYKIAPEKEIKKITTWIDLFIPEERERLLKAVEYVFKNEGAELDIVLSAKLSDNNLIYIKVRGRAIRDEAHRVLRLIGICWDMTQQKINEIQLEHVREILATTNKLARVGGWEIDLKDNSVIWSEVTAEIHEVESEFVPNLEKGIEFYPKGENRAIILKAIDEAIHQQKPFNEILQIITAKQNLVWVHAIGAPIVENGKTVKISGVFQDIDAQKKAEDLISVQHRQ